MQKSKLFIYFLVFIFGVNTVQSQLNGTYRVGNTSIPGETGSYTTLSAAVAALNLNGVSGPCIFYFSDNGATYTEAADLSLGCTGTSSTNTITFKPYTGVTCSIVFSSATNSSTTGAIDGHLVIGSPTAVNTNLVSTNYVTIDGSNIINGLSKDLTITGTNANIQKSIIRIFGNNDFIVVKNCIINNNSASGSSTAPVQITARFDVSNFIPDNCTVNNNTLNSIGGNGSQGVFIGNSGTPTVGITNVVVSNNIISAKATRAISFNYVSDGKIFNNTISHNHTNTPTGAATIFLTTGTSAAGTFDIYNNIFTQLTISNAGTGASNGLIAIDNQLATPKIVNIFNNQIRGFQTLSASVSNSKIYGIRHTSSSTTNIYHNSIYFNDVTNMSAFGTSFIAGIVYATTSEGAPSGTCNAYNNTIFMDESSMKVAAIRRMGTGGTFNCNNNILYLNPNNANAIIGTYNGNDYATFSSWKSNTTYDANSYNLNPGFTSATDLTPSFGNFYPGTFIASVTTDINGITRSTTKPNIGANESTVKQWLGTTSDWSLASNWRDNLISSSGEDAIIVTGTTNPVLAANTTLDSIYLQNLTALSIATNTFTLNGAFLGTGTLTGSFSSNLVLGGTAGIINFTSGSRMLKDFTLNTGATATLGTALEISAGATPGLLTVGTGSTLTTAGLLTLNSDALGTASLGNSAGTINGNITIQRYIPSGTRRFRFLSHPFNTARPINILSGLSYTGAGGTGNGFTHTTATNNPSVFSFTTANANGATNDGGWTAFSDATTANWGVGQGIRILVRGTLNEGLDGNTYTPSATTINMTGAVNVGAVNVPLVVGGSGSSENFNLVGNPYPSPINIEDVVTANTNVSKTIYLRNPSTGSYITKDLSVLANADYSIPANAAFFVVPSSATSLAFAETNKVASASLDVVFNQTVKDPTAYIELQTLVNQEVYDNMYIKFDKNWSAKFDHKTDATKAQNDFVNVYAISEEGRKLAVDARSFIHNSIIPLGVTLNSGSRTLTIKASTFNIDNDLYEVTLFDKLTNTKTVLSKDASYSFVVNMNEANSYGNDRLQLLLSTKKTLQPVNDVIAAGFKVKLQSTIIGGQIAVNLENAVGKTTIKVVNSLGQIVVSKDANNITSGTVNIASSTLGKGVYFVQVQNGSTAITLKATKP